jgi:ribosome assembly protein YihI (activator of Der GTPase)
MSRSKKSRKPGGAPTAKPKLSKVELSNVEKRVRKKTGNKPGNRQQEAKLDNNSGQQVDLNKDPRIGSKKSIDLGGPVKAVKSKEVKAVVKTTKPKQDPIAALRTVSSDDSTLEISLAQELANIESDEKLQVILAKQDDDIALTQDEVEYFNNMMERHEAISVELDDDDEDEIISTSASSEDDLWDKLDNSPLPGSNK